MRTIGRGRIEEGSQTIIADEIDFDQQTGFALALGSVIMRDTAAGTILESERAEYFRETGYVKAFGLTRPLLKSTIDADTMYVTADTLISYEVIDSLAGDTVRHMTGYRDVRIFRGTMQGLCDSLTFDGRDSVFRMHYDPVMWSDSTQFIADTIDLHMKNKVLTGVLLRNNGIIISEVRGTFYNQIKGKHIQAAIADNEIRNMHVSGNAESIYYAQDDEQAFMGVNQVASSEIFFTFVESRIDQITFTTKPSGTMTPMGQVDHEQLRLEGFNWRAAVRPKVLEDLY
jgi:hypothetical protein